MPSAPPRLARSALALSAWGLVFAVGCGSLIRFGEIEPSSDEERVITAVEIRPRDRSPRAGLRLEAALSDLTVATHAASEAPVVSTDVATGEMTLNVQGLTTPADQSLADPAVVATDARRLESIYMARGYFRAKTLRHAIEPHPANRGTVVFELSEDRPTHVSEVRFLNSCTELPEDDPEGAKRLRALCGRAATLIPLRVGDVWTESAYAAGLDILARAFRAQGFLHARVTGDNWVSRDRYEAAVWYHITAGPLVRAQGDVDIQGFSRVSQVRIRRRVTIEPGDVLDAAALRLTERRVLDLGPFVSVQAQPLRGTSRRGGQTPLTTARDGEDDEGERPEDRGQAPIPPLARELRVRLQVAEAARWELSVGPSFVTDFTRLDLALPIALTHRNLFGELAGLTAQARPAIVFPDCFTGEACFDQYEFGLTSKLALQVPSFFEEFLRLSIDATYRRDPTQSSKSQELGGSIGWSRKIVEWSENLTVRFGYNVAYFNYFSEGALEGLGAATAIDESAFRFQTQDFLAYFDAALHFDLRDSPLDARNGLYAALTANVADRWTGSDVAYTRLVSDVRGYWTPRWTSWLTLALRLKVGWNLFPAAQGTPEPVRFKSGGATTMRGFTTNRMGDFVCRTPDADGNLVNSATCGRGSSDRTYIGGNFLFESNAELRLRFRGGLGLVAFIDVGRLWSRAADVNFGDLFVAVGPGLRYDLPVGPVRLDVGFRLGRARATEVHFSLGQAF